MRQFRSRHVRLVVVPFVALSFVSACGKWTMQQMAPSQVITRSEPSRVRLTLSGGEKVELGDPVLSDGEIVGHPVNGPSGQWHYSLRYDTNTVARIETRETDALATAAAVTLGLVAVFPVAVLVALSGWDGPFGRPRR